MPLSTLSRLRDRLRREGGSAAVNGFFRAASRVGLLHPEAAPGRHGITVTRDLPYRDGGAPEHRLDVWQPPRPEGQSLPVVLYVHGGGFRILSKDTHWIMALAFARRGYLVFNVSYRLAPAHPFPAAVCDVADAYAWVVRNAARFGGDPARLVLAGESAGANLVTALTLSACYARDEPFARVVHDTGVVPRAVVASCGLFQVSEPGRIARRKPRLSRFVADRIEEVSTAYLGHAPTRGPHHDFADVLPFLERGEPPTRPLPPFFLPCGTADPLLDDTRRLHAALDRLGAGHQVRYYPGEPHAFHAFVFREPARRCWADTFAFLADALG